MSFANPYLQDLDNQDHEDTFYDALEYQPEGVLLERKADAEAVQSSKPIRGIEYEDVYETFEGEVVDEQALTLFVLTNGIEPEECIHPILKRKAVDEDTLQPTSKRPKGNEPADIALKCLKRKADDEHVTLSTLKRTETNQAEKVTSSSANRKVDDGQAPRSSTSGDQDVGSANTLKRKAEDEMPRGSKFRSKHGIFEVEDAPISDSLEPQSEDETPPESTIKYAETPDAKSKAAEIPLGRKAENEEHTNHTSKCARDSSPEVLVTNNHLKRKAEDEKPFGEGRSTHKHAKVADVKDQATKPALKRKLEVELENPTESSFKRAKGIVVEEQVTTPTLKRKAGDEQPAEPTPKRAKGDHLDEKVTAPLLKCNAEDEQPAKPTIKRARGDHSEERVTVPSLKRKAEDEKPAEPTLKRMKGNDVEEQTTKPSLKRKAEDDHYVDFTPKGTKGNDTEKQIVKPTMEHEAKDKKSSRATSERAKEDDLQKQVSKSILKRKAENEPLGSIKKAKLSKDATATAPSSTTPTEISPLRRLPGEIREIIFNMCDLEWNGRSPSLIRALRQDPILHAEAMRVFFQRDNTYSLNRRNNWGFKAMSVDMILTIKKIKIEIQEYRPNPKFGKIKHQPKFIQVPHFTKMKKTCSWPIHVQEVIIEGTFRKVHPKIVSNFEYYLAGFQQRLKKVTLDLRFGLDCPNDAVNTRMAERITNLFKTEWHTNIVRGGVRRSGKLARYTWSWEAPKDKYLKRVRL